MKTIYRHELDTLDRNISTYLVGTALLITVGIASLFYNINNAVANFEYVLASAAILYAVVVPVLTMKSISEERKQKTDQLLYSLPFSMTDIVLGKYLALVTELVLPLLFVAFYPLVFKNYGNVYLPTSFGSLFAFLLLGMALLAVGMFISSLTENQGFAAGITVVLIVLNYYSVSLADEVSDTALGSLIVLTVFVLLISLLIKNLTKSGTVAIGFGAVAEAVMLLLFFLKQELFVGLVPNFMEKISLFERFYTFVDGVFDITAVVYYLTVIVFFLFLCVQSLEKRRYNG